MSSTSPFSTITATDDSSSATPPPPPPPDHLLFPSSSDQLCYVHCDFCNTVLAVSVPCSSLFKTVTVRCGHCSNLLPVNMRPFLLPPPAAAGNHPQLHLPAHTPFFTSPQTLLEEIRNSSPNLLMSHQGVGNQEQLLPVPAVDYYDLPKPPVVNRPPEKRQRVPSAYNRFIKDEIRRIKAENPDISHREAFSAAAKNWAHFPHIHFGLMPDQHQQPVKKPNLRHQDGDDGHGMMKDGLLAARTDVGIAPY